MKPHPDYLRIWKMNEDFVDPITGEKVSDFVKKVRILSKYQDPENLEITDRLVPGLNGGPDVPVRVYRDPSATNAPLLLNIHGGGFIIGSSDQDQPRNVTAALGVPCTVVSVDYRLSPKAIFPAALEDCLAALTHAYEHPAEYGIDPTKIALYGTSAGGCITAGLSLYLRDKGGPKISMQVLSFPTLDYQVEDSSMGMYFGAPMFGGSLGEMPSVWKLYLGGLDGTVPSYYAVPGLARDLTGLPPTCMIVCEYDPLRDQGIKFALRLLQSGVPVELHCLPRVPHGYDMVNAPMTLWMKEGIYASLRREFGRG